MVCLDRVFDLLSDERRRYALYYLEQRDGPVAIDEVAAQVAEWKADPGAVSIPDGKFERLEVQLVHSDLPKAAEVEFVEYDSDAERVEVTDAPIEFTAIVSVAKTIERPDRKP